MKYLHRTLLAAAIAASLGSSVACESFSDSSASISDIVSSPVTSLSRSSSPEIGYREGVRDHVAAQVRSGATPSAILASLAETAKRHGVSDYESNQSTYRGIGAGLKLAGQNQTGVDTFAAAVARTPEQSRWIQRGFEQGV
ncbi:MAG: putative lipoprotein [Deltaproteobacteria bacterium]|nr:putative lipoprotein [Deltaproteobacteria bacterium]